MNVDAILQFELIIAVRKKPQVLEHSGLHFGNVFHSSYEEVENISHLMQGTYVDSCQNATFFSANETYSESIFKFSRMGQKPVLSHLYQKYSYQPTIQGVEYQQYVENRRAKSEGSNPL